MKASIRRGPVWVAMAVAVVAMLWIGARPRPTDGVSDDRLYAIASQLKCLQCAGESVAGSQSSIAIKMREEIRREMRAGRSDDEILDRFVASYPTEVLLNPPRSGLTLLVWVAPVVVVAVGAVGVASSMAAARRARRAAAAHSVTDEEREHVAEMYHLIMDRDPKQRLRSTESLAQLSRMSLITGDGAATVAGTERDAAAAAGLSDQLIAPMSVSPRDPVPPPVPPPPVPPPPVPPPPPVFPDGAWSVGALKRSAT